MQKKHPKYPCGKTRLIVIIVILVGLALGGWAVSGSLTRASRPAAVGPATYPVSRQDLTIRVTENGNLKALESVDIKSEVEGRTMILSVVPEGTYLTDEDVANGRIIVELDKSAEEEEVAQREIDFASAEASFTEAKEAYEIQLNQNESDIKASELKVKFSLMDLQKYVGSAVADQVIEAGLQEVIDSAWVRALLNEEHIGGETLQSLRKLQADIDLALEKLQQDENDLEWTRKLYEKDYATRNELEKSELTVKSQTIQVEQARTSQDLYIKYEFPKQVEQLYSDYQESQRELERTGAKARATLAQAQARLKSNEARYLLEKTRLEENKQQLASCIMRAPAPGLVVYASESRGRFSDDQPIEAGAEVRERQKILSIPNLNKMGVSISVHETAVDKVRVGQLARVVLDAFPDKVAYARVTKVATLPDSQSSWLNPDLKVYPTEVAIDGTYDFLRPGMSAQVEIIVEQLDDVLVVPVQAVASREGKKLCYIAKGGSVEPREVVTGSFDENFIVIREGLDEGDEVSLQPPREKLRKMDRPLPEELQQQVAAAATASEQSNPRGVSSPGMAYGAVVEQERPRPTGPTADQSPERPAADQRPQREANRAGEGQNQRPPRDGTPGADGQRRRQRPEGAGARPPRQRPGSTEQGSQPTTPAQQPQ